ncbi:MAG: hypothetical protein KGJ04_07045 [Gammaproteobacteria bacterium]|nr:hypothetical protein [Gammaproteobacteria bacterium]
MSPELQKLDVSAGYWVYHGQTLNTPFGKAGNWTWNEDCGWSANQVFMMCSFTNDWSGKIIKSLVVDTYNEKDKSYSHYELFNGGDSGAEPFISKMTINGNTRIEYATDSEHGKKTETRITYTFDSPTHVKVKIEISHDGTHWVTVDEGEGVKQP